MTNLELVEEKAQGQGYCGNACHIPKVTTTLPCFKAKIQGKPGLALIDTGATTNFVNRAFLEESQGTEEMEGSTTICLADGTTRGRCPV